MDNELKKKIDGYGGNILINTVTPLLRNKPLDSRCNILKNPKKILLIKFWGIGNLVMITPSMKAVRKRYPNSKIYFLTLYRNKDLLENLRYIDEIIYYRVGSFDILKVIYFVVKYYKEFDIVIDFEQFLNVSAIMSSFIGKITFGFSNKTRARYKMYDIVEPYRNEDHMVDQFYNLCRRLGVPKRHLRLENFDFIGESNRVSNFFRRNNINVSNQVVIGVHIGTSENALVRRWPVHYFIELMNLLNNNLKNLIFVITGVKTENDEASYVTEKIIKMNCYNSCGLFDIKDLIYFIKKCDLFISNDTGPIHIAAACGVTCVGFYGPNTPKLYGPYGIQHLVFYKGMKCSPCITNYNTKTTSCNKAACIEGITPEEVAVKIINYINQNKKLFSKNG